MLSDEAIVALHKKHAPSHEAFQLVYTHCEIIWQIARQLIETSSLRVDTELVKAACLLHDIGVYRLYLPSGEIDHANYVKHGILGYELLKEEGLPEKIRRFASHHTGVGLSREDVVRQRLPLPPADYLAETPEERLLMYADKFHSKSTPPKFLTAAAYEKKVAQFGKGKIEAFRKLQREFGTPDLASLAAKYGHELI